MTISLDYEDSLVQHLMHHPDEHLLMPSSEPTAYGGRYLVSRGGLRRFLHRELYIRVIGLLLPSQFLLPNCEIEGCQNPWHFAVSASPKGTSPLCPNGHTYAAEDWRADGSRRCSTCAEARAKRRRTGGTPYWVEEKARTHCPYDHPYSGENLYLYSTPAGVRRKCRACTIARSAGKDPSEIVVGA